MIGFEPTHEEQAAILRCRKLRKLVVGGGQAGKSLEAVADWSIHLAEDRANHPWTGSETLLYWLVAADYERCRSEWDYIIKFLDRMGFPVDADKRIDPGRIIVQLAGEKYPRIVVETKSGKDPRTLAMFSPHGIIVCEASQIDYFTYEKCIERVTASGGWLHMSGTYEYESTGGWYHSLAAAWAHGSEDKQSFRLDATKNKYVYPGGDDDPKILALKRDSSDAFFLERIKGLPAPRAGRVLSEARADIHIREVHYNPDLPLYIWDDPGYGHAHAIEIAQIAQGGMVGVFDEIYERHLTTEALLSVVMKREWWANPNKTLVIDPNYAPQHHSTHSVAEIWMEIAHLATLDVRVGISEGIERFKTFLKVDPLSGAPGIVFDPRCKGILSELGLLPSPFYDQPRWEVYSWKTDREGNTVGDTPDDRFNDAVKAITYGLVQHFGLSTAQDSQFFEMRRHGKRIPSQDLRAR